MPLIRPDGAAPRDTRPTRRAFGVALLAGCAVSSLSGCVSTQAPMPASTGALIDGMVDIPQFDGPLPAYIARPGAGGGFPAIIVVSEVFGLHDYIRDVCRRLAGLGYVAIAPDYFHRAGSPARETDAQVIQRIASTATNEQVLSDTGATLRWLQAQPFSTRNVGITGFSWGGAVVWMACERFAELRAGVAWYGRLVKPASGFLSAEPRPWPINIAPTLQSRVLGLYAGRDQGIPQGDIDAMREVLRFSRKADNEIIVYPNAQHGFHADYRPTTYDAAAAADGWGRMLDHFARNGLAPRRWR